MAIAARPNKIAEFKNVSMYSERRSYKFYLARIIHKPQRQKLEKMEDR